jgi:hypothetical protein
MPKLWLARDSRADMDRYLDGGSNGRRNISISIWFMALEAILGEASTRVTDFLDDT